MDKLTGRSRLRPAMIDGNPVLVLQLEVSPVAASGTPKTLLQVQWRDATIEDLTVNHKTPHAVVTRFANYED